MRAASRDFGKLKTKHAVLECYVSELCALRDVAKEELSIEGRKFEELLIADFEGLPLRGEQDSLFSERSMREFGTFLLNDVGGRTRRYLLYCAVILLLFLSFNCKSDLSHAFMRNIQTSIYPLMFCWRKLTLPLLQAFPELAALYDESCLIPNPLFQVADLDCSPCERFSRVKTFRHAEELIYADRSVPHILQVRPLRARSRDVK